MSNPNKILRRIRSFVKREGRLTPGQQRALDTLMPKWGLTFDDGNPTLPDDDFFQKDSKRYLEIGFGSGETLAEMGQLNPDKQFIGMEVHRPGVGNLLLRMEERELENIRVIIHDAVEVVNSSLFNFKFDGIYLLFADPWPKRKHHKRRIVQTDFVNQVSKLIKPGGYFYIATDWDDYAKHIREVMAKCTQFTLEPNKQGEDGERYPQSDDVIHRPHSKYEQRGLRLGHKIHDMVYRLA